MMCTIPLQVLHSLNVVCIDVQSRFCHLVHKLHVPSEVGSEALHKYRVTPVIQGKKSTPEINKQHHCSTLF